MKAQGSELYAIDPDSNEIIAVGCILDIDGIDTTVEQIEVTCLSDLARQYDSGLATPGRAQFSINSDPTDATHLRLHALKVAGKLLKWAVGWSDGTGTEPDVATDGDFDLPDTRSWLTFQGFMNSFPFNFSQNAHVRSQIGVQMSGEPSWVAKAVSS